MHKINKRKKTNFNSIMVIVIIITIIISASTTYLLTQQNYEEKINQINEEYEKQNKNTENLQYLEFERNLAQAGKTLNLAFLNEGFAATYYNEANYYYNKSNFRLAEKFYAYALPYYDTAFNVYSDSKTYFQLLKNYAIEQNEYNLINDYIDFIDLSKDIITISYKRCYNLSVASAYYNISNFEIGDTYRNEANDLLNNYNKLIKEYNEINFDIDSLLESSWIDSN